MLYKLVNGEHVELTPEEESEITSFWAANQEKTDLYLINDKYKDDRKRAYPTIEELTVALWEKLIEDKPELAVELQEKRLLVKQQHPKPEL